MNAIEKKAERILNMNSLIDKLGTDDSAYDWMRATGFEFDQYVTFGDAIEIAFNEDNFNKCFKAFKKIIRQHTPYFLRGEVAA